MNQLLEELNGSQKLAVLHKEGPLVVFAGAGSGKTRVITTRIAHLINSGVKPWEILAVTFTNKAAGEMRARVQLLCKDAGSSLISTFHSASARWLREYASHLGFDSNFTIYDDYDSTTTLKRIIKTANISGDPAVLLQSIKSFILTAKMNAFLPSDQGKIDDYFGRKIPSGAVAIYKMYQEALASSNAMDFGDLLLHILVLLRDHKDIRERMQNRYRYILVDEFQDTNQTQFELVRILSEKHRNLFVVGDDDQSIYSWRGASPSNILNFKNIFPDARIITLDQNYRCTANIVDAANTLISNNKTRAPKTLFSKSPPGDLIEYRREVSSDMEAHWVVSKIQDERNQFKYDQVSIFYRTNAQSRSFEEYLTRKNIPYTIFGTLEFYNRLEIKDLLAYLRLLVNEDDEASLRRILNVPTRGLGSKAIETIEEEARKRNLPLMRTIMRMAEESYERIGPKLNYFCDLIKALRKDILSSPVDRVIEILLGATDYKEYLKKKFPDQYNDKLENIHELGSALTEYHKSNPDDSLLDWLNAITLVKSTEDDETITGVSLMTLHMAKGLEYDRVYITGVEDGLLPHKNSLDKQKDIEEERRLFYVGMTRAKKKLTLVNARTRQTFNTSHINDPSRFLKEIPKKYLKYSSEAEFGDSFSTPRVISFNNESAVEAKGQDHDIKSKIPIDDLKEGSIVCHPTYGKGVVKGFDDNFDSKKVVVQFYEFGLRKIRPSWLEVIKI
ncbi:MAG: UvrD-helicase domain-containing protein [Oligoflexales bacterium]|nr:UvrD-helicase domain-containing protein [Oligoflexales bacterium]